MLFMAGMELCRNSLVAGHHGSAKQCAVKHCYSSDVSQTDYSLLICSLMMCTPSVVSIECWLFKPSQAKPSQSVKWGAETCAKHK